jgi:hypothetical protein
MAGRGASATRPTQFALLKDSWSRRLGAEAYRHRSSRTAEACARSDRFSGGPRSVGYVQRCLIHQSAWNMNSRKLNFRCYEFSEVELPRYGVLGSWKSFARSASGSAPSLPSTPPPDLGPDPADAPACATSGSRGLGLWPPLAPRAARRLLRTPRR